MEHTEYVHDEETGEEVKKASTKTITESTIDPESGCFHKGEKVFTRVRNNYGRSAWNVSIWKNWVC